MISWGPSIQPLHDPAEHGDGAWAAQAERGFGITLDGFAPAEHAEQGLDAFDGGSESDRLDA